MSVNARQDEAKLDGWIVLRTGGREIFTVRDHFIYKEPAQNQNYWGRVLRGQMMHWTGEIRETSIEVIVRNLYHVDSYRIDRSMSGWFSDMTAKYIYPSEDNDPKIGANSKNVFDLTQPILRHPQDQNLLPLKQQDILL